MILLASWLVHGDGWCGELNTGGAGGYSILQSHSFLPPDFDDQVFNELWTVWPEPQRTEAQLAEPVARRRLTFSYYGIIENGDSSNQQLTPLGYNVDSAGQWTMNCLACHGGKVAGKVIPGLPNSHTALQTLTEDVRSVKTKLDKPLSHLDLGSLQLPLNASNGTTNSVVFGIVLGAFRRPDMTVDLNRKLPPLVHHDMETGSRRKRHGH